MSATETELTPEQIKEWATKDLVISELSSGTTTQRYGTEPLTRYGIETDFSIQALAKPNHQDYYISAQFPTLLTRFQNPTNTRRIGYIAGVNTDGSYQLYILGNGAFPLKATHQVFTLPEIVIEGEGRFLPPQLEDYFFPERVSGFGPYAFSDNGDYNRETRTAMVTKYEGTATYLDTLDSFMYHPTWVATEEAPQSFVRCGKKGNDYLIDLRVDSVNLTNDISSTVKLGDGLNCKFWQQSQAGFFYADKNIGGDLYDLLDTISLNLCGSVANIQYSLACSTIITQGYDQTEHETNILNTYPPIQGFMAYHYKPYNLILTHDLEQAKHYVETGDLPSDAFIYPFDVDNIPINKEGGTSPDDSDGSLPDDTPDTGGDSGGDDVDNAPPRKPSTTPQALTNNNLYWLTNQQLRNFINWFWTDATDVTNPQELFEKIQGLYSDLSQAIVAIRYMPVDTSWVGGVSLDSKIVVGLVEKTEQVQTINKTVADIRTIGEIEITELEDFKGFINYSPYCQMSLYLPFYGFIDLDCDLLMPNDKRKNTNKLKVYATYDILSGTIQYFIYRVSSTGNENMINCVSAKMAVDIPISLQTKTERDSMIFNNVSSATANLVGAGASVASGNPIGLVMSTAAIAGQQSAGAPMRVMGTIGESGAFYDDGHCALYIKRPATNYPPQYAKRIGYPYNAKKKLSEISGFVQCQNPYISFSHVTAEDSDGFPPPKPTAEEIDTIYAALQEGVYLP